MSNMPEETQLQIEHKLMFITPASALEHSGVMLSQVLPLSSYWEAFGVITEGRFALVTSPVMEDRENQRSRLSMAFLVPESETLSGLSSPS